MPALSPTMETGILAEWYIQEGSSFAAGEAIAKIETDKASIDFEAQDDGYVAKILMEAGSGNDIPVNTPIMITVEEESDVAAFHDYVLESTAAAPAAVAAPVSTPSPPPAVAPAVAPVPASTSTPPAAPAPVATPLPSTPVTAAPPSPVVAAVPPPSMEALMAAVAPVMSTGWGEFAKLNSPILKTLSKQQNEYISKYGTTGQLPL